MFDIFALKIEEDVKKSKVYIFHISNLKALLADLKTIWQTTTIQNYMFTRITGSSLEFYSFFVPDLYFTLEKILEEPKLRINRKLIKEIMEGLKTNTWFKDWFKIYPLVLNFKRLGELKYTLLPTQLEAVKAYDHKTQALHLNGYLLAADVGTGKAQPLDAKIKVPGGWSTIGAMEIGTKVIAKDGSVCNVIGLNPQGIKEVFKITFEDNRSTECCVDHLWKVHFNKYYETENETVSLNNVELYTTKDILDFLNNRQVGLYNFIQVDLITPEEIEDIDLDENLYETSIHNKHIPESFNSASPKQKIKLLQKIFNITSEKPTFSGISSYNEQYLLDIQKLVWSLGGIASIKPANSRYRLVVFFNGMSNPFVTNDNKNFKLTVKKIESNGYKEMQCITIDHPDQLYVTDNYIVTHNSIMGLAIANCAEKEKAIVVCPKSIIDSVWVDAITTQFHGLKKIYAANTSKQLNIDYDYFIFNYEALDIAVDFVKRNKIIDPVIILDESHNLNNPLSLRTMSFLELCNLTKSKNIIFESGTPVGMFGKETIPLLRAIDPLFNAKVEASFKSIFSNSARRSLEILKNRLGMISHKINKNEVMGEAKPIFETIMVSLPDSEKYTLDVIRTEFKTYMAEKMKEYLTNMSMYENVYKEAIEIYSKTISDVKQKEDFNKYKDYIITIRKGFDAMTMSELSMYCNAFEKNKIMPILKPDLRNDFRVAKGIYKYPRLVVLGNFLGNVLAKKRIQLHTELIEHSNLEGFVDNSIKKTIFFTDYVDTAVACKAYFEHKGYVPCIVYSETNKDVNNIIEKFKSNEHINPLIATIKSLSTGVTLTCANTLVFLNLPYRSKDKEQAVARIFRLGQTEQCYVYEILLDTGETPNLSTRMKDIISFSEEQVEAIVGTKDLEIAIESLNDNVYIEEYNNIISLEMLNEKTTIVKLDKTVSVFDW